MVMNVWYFVMLCYINGYKDFGKPLMLQNEETFDALKIIEFETDYDIKLEEVVHTNLSKKTTQPSYGLSKPVPSPVLTNVLLEPGPTPPTLSSPHTLFLDVSPTLLTPHSSIIPLMVKTTEFLKYPWLTLTSEENILTFYNNV